MSDTLPNGWVWAKMLDILDYEGGSQPPKKKFIYAARDGYVRLLQIRDFGDKPYPTYVPDTAGLKRASRDDLLLARYGGSAMGDSLGRICSGLEGAYNVALAKLIFPRHLLDKDYLERLFMGPWLREKVSKNSRSCQTGFNRGDLADVLFPIAPLAEQRRIATALNELLRKIDICQQRLAKVSVLLKRFRQSVLAAACSGRLTADWREEHPNQKHPPVAIQRLVGIDNRDDSEAALHEIPESWIWTELNRVCTKITDGEHLTPPLSNKGVPLLSAKDVRENRLDFSDCKFVSEEFAKKSRARCNPERGDVLVVSRGATVGRTCRVQADDVFCLMGSVLLFKPNQSLVMPQLIEICFRNH